MRVGLRWFGIALFAGAAVIGVALAFGAVGANNASPTGDPVAIRTCQSIGTVAAQYGTLTNLVRGETSNAHAVAYWQEHRGRSGITSPFSNMPATEIVTVCLFDGEFTTPMGPPPPNGNPNPPANEIRLLVYGNEQVVLDSAGYQGHMNPETPADIGAH